MEAMGIDATIETMEDLENVVKDGAAAIAAVKDSPLKLAQAVISLGTNLVDLVAGAPDVLPELADLDEEEAGQIGQASYKIVKTLIEAIKQQHG